MPVETEFAKAIPKIYRRSFLDTSVFSWINALKYTLNHLSIESCLNGFYKFYDVDENDYPRKTAIQTYVRMTKELHKKIKDDGNTKKN